MAIKAISKSIRISPRKVGVVADLVRGRSVKDALIILEHTPRGGAQSVAKAISSAKANADYNHNYKPDSLVITEITVNKATPLKRYRPAAHGRALPYQKRTSHITVIVDGEKRQPKKPATKPVGEKEAK